MVDQYEWCCLQRDTRVPAPLRSGMWAPGSRPHFPSHPPTPILPHRICICALFLHLAHLAIPERTRHSGKERDPKEVGVCSLWVRGTLGCALPRRSDPCPVGPQPHSSSASPGLQLNPSSSTLNLQPATHLGEWCLRQLNRDSYQEASCLS